MEDSKKIELKKTIEWYIQYYSSIHWSNELFVFSKSLLSRFEAHLLQGEFKVKWIYLLLVYYKMCMYKPVAQIEKGKKDTIYFWPFQFLHCDFMEPVIKSLIDNGYSVSVIVFRRDLAKYLNGKNIDVKIVDIKQKRHSLKSVVVNIVSIVRMLFYLAFQQQSNKIKQAVLNTMLYSPAIRNGLEAIRKIAIPDQGQYHVIGNDLSIVGRALIHELNKLKIPSGRLQNGAINYLLFKYSEVSEVFVWDILSEKACKNQGYSGKCIITGNILLFDKIKYGFKNLWINELISYNDLHNLRAFVAFSGPGHNTSVEGHVKTLECLKGIVEKHNKCIFLIKLHPKDKIEYYSELKQIENVRFVDSIDEKNRPDALDCIMASDLLITGASTVAIDALQLNKKVISIDPLSELLHFDFLKEPNVLKYSCLDDLHDFFENLNNSKSNYRYNAQIQDPVNIVSENIFSTLNKNYSTQNNAYEVKN